MTKLEQLREKINEINDVLDLMYNYLSLYEDGKISVNVQRIKSGSLSKVSNFNSSEKRAFKSEFLVGVQTIKDKADEIQEILV